MFARTTVLAAVGALLASCAPASQPVQAVVPTADVTFSKDVAPLLTRSCAGCHNPGGRGAAKVEIFDAAGAVSHANVGAKIALIASAVESGKMPMGKPKLTGEEVGVLKKWQSQGTPNN